MDDIVFHNVSKKFGGIRAINKLNIKVSKEKITSLIGPNGAGKTTVFNLATGVYPPSEGTITFGKKEISRLKSSRIISCGIARTFQNIRLFKSMTVLENVQVGMHCRSKSGIFRVLLKTGFQKYEEGEITRNSMEILQLMGLSGTSNECASNLPYGAQRRLEIARALASNPKILLLDEPAAGMNPSETADLMRLILKLRDSGLTIFLVEHDMRLVMGISEMIIVLDYGTKIAEGTPKEIQENSTVIGAYLGRQSQT